MDKKQSSLTVKGGRTIRETVYKKLYKAIMEGHFMPGQRLYERELALEMGVSRTPVREALRELEQVKLVKSEAHRGVVVNYLTLEEAIEVYEARSQLEALVARKAAQKATEKELQEMEKTLDELELALQKKLPSGYIKIAEEFHRLVAIASKHRIATDMLDSLSNYINLLRAELVPLRNRPEETLVEHRAILTALKARDSAAAEKAVRLHIQKIMEVFISKMKQEKTSAGF